jgi:hypothetical protein
MRETQIVTPHYAKPEDYEYTIEQTGSGHSISYRRQKWGWVLISVTALALVMPWFLFNGSAIQLLTPPITDDGVIWSFAMAWPLAAISGYLLVRFLNSLRRPRTFSITPHFVEVNGKRYDRQHIRDVYVKAPYREDVREPVIQNRGENRDFIALGASGALGGGGLVAAGAVTATRAAEDAGRAFAFGLISGVNTWNRSRGWSIWINYGEKPARLVRGLGERQSEMMANDLLGLLRS